VEWDCGTPGIGVLAGDSLMFQRGAPTPSDKHLSHFYGLAMPLVKRGVPVTPVQLENVSLTKYLDAFKVLLLSYQGMKPLTPEVHTGLAAWVKGGGVLVVCDDDSDPFNAVRDWWNSGDLHFATPREHLFAQLGIKPGEAETEWPCGKGKVIWHRRNPAKLATNAEGDQFVANSVKQAAQAAKLSWRETNYLLLRRGPYVVAAGLDESIGGEPKTLTGRFINLFDPEQKELSTVTINPGDRYLLRDINFTAGPTSK
jgi:hypothetical protein